MTNTAEIITTSNTDLAPQSVIESGAKCGFLWFILESRRKRRNFKTDMSNPLFGGGSCGPELVTPARSL